ncbi:EamA family transporter [Natrinema sp. LN54]|uniref:EamA family transporter n=1 Tax=Natrinema sp. LN54 TaxID=3458705 RepID=UPI0040365B86
MVAAFVGIGLAMAGAVFLAMQALFIRIGTDEGGVVNALLVVLASNILFVVVPAAIYYYPTYQVTAFSLFVFVAAGITGTVLARSLYYLSIERIGASRTEPIKSSQPLHATIIAIFVLSETVTFEHLIGIVLITTGIILISFEITSGEREISESSSITVLLLPLTSAFFFGIEPTFVKLGFQEGTPVYVGLAIKVATASIGFLGYLWFVDRLPTPRSVLRTSGRWYIAAGLVNTGFLYAYYMALERTAVSIVVPIVQTSPLLVAFIAYLMLSHRERVTMKTMAAAVVVVVGAIIITLYSSI